MKIAIREKLMPFSHLPGAACLLPGTCIDITAFPTLIQIGKMIELRLHVTGPVKDFTLQQDLEKNAVYVFGKAKEGQYHLKITAEPNGIEVKALRAPKVFLINGEEFKTRLFFDEEIEFYLPKTWERLSLGMNKAQDWDLTHRRMDLKEILPFIFGLGQKIPYVKPHPLRGTGRLLEKEDWEGFCRTAFSKILVPRFHDTEHQGIAIEEEANGSPCYLLQEAYRKIRALFFDQDGDDLFFLPKSTFPAGRIITSEIALEWGSHTLRRAILKVTSSSEIKIHLPKGLKSFRIRTSQHAKGSRHIAKETLILESGKTYFLDRFYGP